MRIPADEFSARLRSGFRSLRPIAKGSPFSSEKITDERKKIRHLIYLDVRVSLGRIVKRILVWSECDEKWPGRKPNYKQEEIECCRLFNEKNVICESILTSFIFYVLTI